jgi:hypothetical protein
MTTKPKPLEVFCARCLQPVGLGCRDLAHRSGQFEFAPLLPDGVFHRARIEAAEKIAFGEVAA